MKTGGVIGGVIGGVTGDASRSSSSGATGGVAAAATSTHHLSHSCLAMPLPVGADGFCDPTGVGFQHDDGFTRDTDHLVEAERGAREVVQAILDYDEIVGSIFEIHGLGVEEAGL